MSTGIRNIVQLRQLLAERFPNARLFSHRAPAVLSSCHPTGINQVDLVLEGGLPKGAITEVVAAHSSSGSSFITLALLREAQRARGRLALVDSQDSFDPTQLDNTLLSRLLWIRCRNAAEAMRAADLLVRDDNLPVTVLDLRMSPQAQMRKIPATAWYRLQRFVERNGSVLLVVTPFALVGSAQARLSVRSRFAIDTLNRSRDELSALVDVELLRSHGVENGERDAVMEVG